MAHPQYDYNYTNSHPDYYGAPFSTANHLPAPPQTPTSPAFYVKDEYGNHLSIPSSPVNMPESMGSLPVRSQTPTSPAFYVRHGYGNHLSIPQKCFPQATESQQQSEYGNRKTKLDAESNSTARKLKKLVCWAKRSSHSGTQMVGLDDQSPGISMPTPQGANLSADWRSPSPSLVSTPRSEMGTEPMFLRDHRVRLGVPLPLPSPSPVSTPRSEMGTEPMFIRDPRVRLGVPLPSSLDMPQSSTPQVTFPNPQQG